MGSKRKESNAGVRIETGKEQSIHAIGTCPPCRLMPVGKLAESSAASILWFSRTAFYLLTSDLNHTQ